MNRYDITSLLAEGGQGRVYRASDRITGQNCVLKTGNTARAEALLALQLSHPYLARPFDAGIDSTLGQYAAYPEYTETPLLEWSKNSSKGDLQRVVLQIAEFLAFLHRRGWLYHDFKPEHVLVARQTIRMLDLGLAQPVQETSHTYSGTFPYIAPERLTGRKCDVRSDIFALGMLLLHVLLPDENWDFEPSVEVLHNLQKRTRRLSGFWKDLVSEMIPLEPAQRIESAAELWKRLLPKTARSNFLFFSMPPYFNLPSDFLQKNQIAIFQTASNLNLSEIERITLQESWKQDVFTASFDFRHKTPEEVLRTLCRAQLNEETSDLFSAIECLQKAKQSERFRVILRYPEILNSSQRALLSYALTALQNVHSLHFVLLSTKKAVEMPEESASSFEVPSMTKLRLNEILPLAFPSEGLRQERVEKLKARGYTLPDQVMSDLRSQLSQESFLIWPAAARDLAPASSFENLSFTEMRILASLAIASSPVPMEWIMNTLRLPNSRGLESTENLQAKGFVQTQNGCISLVVTPQTVLKRLRKDRIQRIAEALLKKAPRDTDPEVLYRIARASRKKRIAALQAIRVARNLPKRLDTPNEWYWNAFLAGGKLPKSYLYRLANFTLRTGRHKTTKRILRSIRSRFGCSFRYASTLFEFYWRTGNYKSAQQLAKRTATLAQRKGNVLQIGYFRSRQAGSLIHLTKYDEAETVLDSLQGFPSLQVDERAQGFIDHYRGLNYFFRGKFDEAVRYTQRAVNAKHPVQSTSVMNLGIFYARLGRLDNAERSLLKAIRLFRDNNDSQRLGNAFTNLGVLLKQQGKTREARSYYFRSILLSRAYRNYCFVIMNFINIGISYETEGRLRKALGALTRAILLAQKTKEIRLLAFALNHAGRLYAILGKYGKAIECLKDALEIQQDLQVIGELALTHETFGLTYLLSGRVIEAIAHFSTELELSKTVACRLDSIRASLFISLLRNGVPVVKIGDLRLASFELGLYHYVMGKYLIDTDLTNSEIARHLHEAERSFRKVPSLLWLGCVLRLKADYHFQREHLERARIALESAYNIFSRLGARKELLKLSRMQMKMTSSSDLMNRIADRLPYKVLVMIKEVLSEQNPERMINRILSTSLEFTDMERAVLILSENPQQIFKSATLDEGSVQEIYEISQSSLEEAAETQKAFVRLDATSDTFLKGKQSIIANRIRSILCLPLRSGEKTIGVLYLDSKEGIESVAQTESVLLEIFSNIIALVLEDAVELERSKNEAAHLKRGTFPEMIGNSKEIEEVRNKIRRLAVSDHTVLITGETGTGKELVARSLHTFSERKEQPFIPINCASMSETLLESELFGHEKGAFTGADSCKKGLFEIANNGTIFLDEVGDLPYPVQAKLLRVLQEREFRRVGGNELLHTNARVILASNKQLLDLVSEKQFREDLYYRISGIQLNVPPLRKRKEDIALLAIQFLKSAKNRYRKKIRGFSREAIHIMEQYSWPGNIRQLKNEIEKIAALCDNQWIEPKDFGPEIRHSMDTVETLPNAETLRMIEQRAILQRLKEFEWNIVQTAKSLGLTRHGLYNKMKMYSIKRSGSNKKESK